VKLPPGTSPKIEAIFSSIAAQGRPSDAPLASTVANPKPVDSNTELTLAPSNPPASLAKKVVPGSLVILGAAATGAGIIFGAQSHTYGADARTALYDSQMVSYNNLAGSRATAANVSFAIAGTAAAAAVITYLLLK
jgi:hypothetical protein